MNHIKVSTCKEIIEELQEKAIDTITMRPKNILIELDTSYVKMEDVIHVLVCHLKDGAPDKLLDEFNINTQK